MWTLQRYDTFERGLKWYEKKRKNELLAVLDNLDSYVKALNAGSNPLQVKAGFIHVEQKGVLAIDQKGGRGRNLAQTRLYLYPDLENKVIHLLAIGDKKSQKEDVLRCSRFVDDLRNARVTQDQEKNLEEENEGDDNQGEGSRQHIQERS